MDHLARVSSAFASLFDPFLAILFAPIAGTFAGRAAEAEARHGAWVGKCVVIAGSIETLVSEAMQLPPDQRLILAHRILNSVEPTASSEADAAWDAEIGERIARYDAGGVRSIPAAAVFAEVDRRLRG